MNLVDVVKMIITKHGFDKHDEFKVECVTLRGDPEYHTFYHIALMGDVVSVIRDTNVEFVADDGGIIYSGPKIEVANPNFESELVRQLRLILLRNV